jgi:NADH-quinone oxidoreductase subunit E
MENMEDIKMEQSFVFSEENLKIAGDIIKKYPSQNRFSAIMPLLTLAQKQNSGYLTPEVFEYLAKFLNVSTMAFYEVANFYSMYHLNPVGKYVIYVCNSIMCMVKGSEDVYNLCKKLTKSEGMDVSADNLFSVKKVECLGACVNAPAVKINDIFVEDVNDRVMIDTIESLKQTDEIPVVLNVRKSNLIDKQ